MEEIVGTLESTEPLKVRVNLALEQGIVLGVKYGTALLLIAFALSWLVGDYTGVRARAWNGQRAYEMLTQRPAKD